MANENEGNRNRSSNTGNSGSNENRPVPTPPATIAKLSTEIAAMLAPLTPAEQWRVIKAASTINGIEPINAQRQGSQQQRRS